MSIRHIDRMDFLRGSFLHAVQKRAGNVHGIAFLFFGLPFNKRIFICKSFDQL